MFLYQELINYIFICHRKAPWSIFYHIHSIHDVLYGNGRDEILLLRRISQLPYENAFFTSSARISS